jgi:hypothetical protein
LNTLRVTEEKIIGDPLLGRHIPREDSNVSERKPDYESDPIQNSLYI